MSFIDAVAAYREMKEEEGIAAKLYLTNLEIELKSMLAVGKEVSYQAIADRLLKKMKINPVSNADKPEIGDVVEGVQDYVGKHLVGLRGKVVETDSATYFGIEWNENIGGHTCDNGNAKQGHGWNVRREHFKIISKAKPDLTDSITREELDKIVEDVFSGSQEIRVGDEVEIIDGSRYSYTKEGSYGIVKRIKSDEYDIEFHHLTGSGGHVPVTYNIYKGHVGLKNKRELSKEDRAELAKEIALVEQYKADLDALLKKSTKELVKRKFTIEFIADFYESCGIDAKKAGVDI